MKPTDDDMDRIQLKMLHGERAGIIITVHNELT